MAGKKGLEWNQIQLKIAYDIIKNKKSWQAIAEESGLKKTYVFKVFQAIEEGQNPPSLEPSYIQKAPLPEGFTPESYPLTIDEKVTPANSNNGQNTNPPNLETKTAVVQSTMLKLVPGTVTCPLTPIMQMAKVASIKEFNWRSDMPWENFLDTCLYLLFKYWGVTLQGYIVDEEVEKPLKEETHGS